MVGTQAIANVCYTFGEVDMLLDEVFIHRTTLNDVVADVVHDRKIRLRLEDQFRVRQLGGAVRER